MKSSLLIVVMLLSAAVVFGQGRNRDRGQDRGQDPWNYSNHPNWDRSWNDRPMPRAGACFFRDTGFRGDHFCVNQGDRLDSLPGNFGDNISSMQVYGRARVRVYNDRNFSGGSQEFRKGIADLRTARFRDGHTWNDRISSLMVR